jgi:lipopolysaccharide/colanic/teichoic acid biosynthesis glycosyltransferase
VSLPSIAETRLLQLLQKLWVLPVDIRLSAHNNRLRFRPHTYSYIGNVPFIDLADKPIANWDYVLKWLFDKVVACTAMIFLAPLMALIAIAIKLDSKGPVLFRQKRQGFNNELIEIFKFRAMYTDRADAEANKLVTKQ